MIELEESPLWDTSLCFPPIVEYDNLAPADMRIDQSPCGRARASTNGGHGMRCMHEKVVGVPSLEYSRLGKGETERKYPPPPWLSWKVRVQRVETSIIDMVKPGGISVDLPQNTLC